MLVLVHAAKGGVGVTTFVTSLALADRDRPALMVDLAGDLHLALDVEVGDRPGVVDWLESDAAPGQLDQLVVDVDRTVELLPAGRLAESTGAPAAESRWAGVARWLLERSTVDGSRVVIDAGTQPVGHGLLDACAHRLLVTRRCYLSLRRPASFEARPTGIVLIDEPGRILRRTDVEQALGQTVIADVPHDVGVANRVDTGLLHAARPPRPHARSLRSIWRRLESDTVGRAAA